MRVLVTGGSSDLGRAILEVFAKSGYDVVFTYNSNKVMAQEISSYIKKEYKVDVEVVRTNLLDDADIDSLVDKIDNLDVLVNNAALTRDCYIFSKTSSDFIDVLKVNLVSPFILSQKLYPLLKKNEGSIINIASTNGIDTMYPEGADYDASKAGLINITKNMANSFSGVRVNAVAPGWIDTNIVSDMDPKFRVNEEKKCALGRFARPEEIAQVVYFLASKDASFVNGSIVRVDGGSRL